MGLLVLMIGVLAVLYVVFRESSRARLIEAGAAGSAPEADQG